MTTCEQENEATLARMAEGFRTRNVEAILAEFADDGVFQVAVGPEPCGERFAGKAAIRMARETMFKGPGDRAISEWLYVLTTRSGRRVEVRGCGLFELGDGKVTRKDTFLKQVVAPRGEPAGSRRWHILPPR